MPVSGVTLVHLKGTPSYLVVRTIAVTGEPVNLSQNRIQTTKYRISQGIRNTDQRSESVPMTVVTISVS